MKSVVLLKELIEYLAQALADRPEAVAVVESRDDKGRLLTLTVSREDRRRLIGKEGRTLRALRTLLTVAGANTGEKCFLKISSAAETAPEPGGRRS